MFDRNGLGMQVDQKMGYCPQTFIGILSPKLGITGVIIYLEKRGLHQIYDP